MTQFIPQVSYDKLVLLGDSSNVDITTNSNNNTNIDTNINNNTNNISNTNTNTNINSNTNIIPLTFVYKSPPVLVPNIR